MTNWKEMTQFNDQDANELINAAHAHLVDMELKNQWDSTVNEFKFQDFLQQAFNYMLQHIEDQLHDDVAKYQWYPKIKEFWDYAELIQMVDCTVNDAIEDFHTSKIYEMVEMWWAETFGLV